MKLVERHDTPRIAGVAEPRSVDRLVEAFAEVGPEEILQVYQPNCCILATRVTIEVLRHFGVNARPLVVKLDAANPAWFYLFEQAKRKGWSRTEIHRRAAAYGAYSIGIGYPTGGHGFDGHVVALLDDRQLLDASIIQVNKPSRGIEVPLVALLRPVSTAFLAGTEPTGCVLPSGTGLFYQRMHSPPDFRNSPDWADERRWGPFVRRIVRRMTDILG